MSDLGNVGVGGALVASGRVQISVSPVNDPPEILLDPEGLGLLPNGGALGTDEDVPLPLALLAIQDKEMSAGGGGRLTVSLQCSNGGFVIASDETAAGDEESAMGVVWAVGGVAGDAGPGPWQTVVYSGGLAETNGVLSKLAYTPAPDWHGVDELNVRLRGCHELRSEYPAADRALGRHVASFQLQLQECLHYNLWPFLPPHSSGRWERVTTGSAVRAAHRPLLFASRWQLPGSTMLRWSRPPLLQWPCQGKKRRFQGSWYWIPIPTPIAGYLRECSRCTYSKYDWVLCFVFGESTCG